MAKVKRASLDTGISAVIENLKSPNKKQLRDIHYSDYVLKFFAGDLISSFQNENIDSIFKKIARNALR